MRKLASLQRVLALEPIPNADRIEVAQINGWRVVVKKGEFQENGLAVFLEIDAVPPDDKRFDWLWQKEGQPHLARPGNFRVKTKKLRGVVSQGVLIPLKEFAGAVLDGGAVVMKAGVDPEALDIIHAQEGDDLTAVLGVDKYEPPPPKSQGGKNVTKRISDFPTYLVPKTDEERVQSCTKVLFELAGKPWVATMKCDGQSATYVYDSDKDDVLFCSRNFVLGKDPIHQPERTLKDGTVLPEREFTSCWVEVGKKYKLHELLRQPEFRDFAIQGEMVGPSSQGNPLGLPEDDIRVFSIFNTKTRQYMTYKEMAKFCKQLGLPIVPILYEGDSFYPELLNVVREIPCPKCGGAGNVIVALPDGSGSLADCETCHGRCLVHNREVVGKATTAVIEDLLKKAEGKYPDTKNEREGLVIRPRDEEMWSDALQGRLSFKCINNKFLLNEKD